MVVNVLQHVTHPSTYEDGDVIFKLIEPEIRAGRPVTLSFSGVSAVPSSFVNGAIVRLVESVPVEAIRARLRITDSTRQINELIKSRLEFVDSQSGAHGRVSLKERWEVVYWTRILNVSEEKLHEAVSRVGADVEDVRRFLAQNV